MSDKKPNQDKKPVCFVLMPISDVTGYDTGHFSRAYEHLIKPAIISAGYTPIRADDEVKTDYIVVSIIQKIVESDMVVCDFSARNPNVMYELGIRHAFNKPVVLIKDKRTEKIFDIQGLRYTEYDESLRIDSVNKDISKISAAISETSKPSSKELNSIVQLAGIKAAEAPVGQTISSDTGLLLSAIADIAKRLDSIGENRSPVRSYFQVKKDGILLDDGEKVGIGEPVFVNGDTGVIREVDIKNQSITILMKSGRYFELSSTSPLAKDLSSLPF